MNQSMSKAHEYSGEQFITASKFCSRDALWLLALFRSVILFSNVYALVWHFRITCSFLFNYLATTWLSSSLISYFYSFKVTYCYCNLASKFVCPNPIIVGYMFWWNPCNTGQLLDLNQEGNLLFDVILLYCQWKGEFFQCPFQFSLLRT